MPAIGIIDDKKKQRESLQKIIADYLEYHHPEWECIDGFPFNEMEEYSVWIEQHDIAALIIDEQLQTEKSGDGTNVDYDGHDLIEFLRPRYPIFPVYAFTALGENEDLTARSSLFEDILEHKQFYNNTDIEIERIIRAGSRFTETKEKELNHMSKVASSIAKGEAVSEDDMKKVKAIKESLQLPFISEQSDERSSLLNELDEQLKSLDELSTKIENHLK